MKVENKNGIGNPYHSDETGEFVSPGESLKSMKNDYTEQEIEEYIKTSGDFTEEEIAYFESLQGEERTNVLKQFNELLEAEEEIEEEIPVKPLSEMSNDELILESRQIYPIVKKYFDINTNQVEKFFGDPMLTVANFRGLLDLHNKYPLKAKIKIEKNNRKTTAFGTATANYGIDFLSKGSVMITRSDGIPQGEKIEICSKVYTDWQSIKAKKTLSALTGYSSQTDGSLENLLKYTIVHEYGHNLAYDIIGDRLRKDDMFVDRNKRLLDGLVGKVVGAAAGYFMFDEIQKVNTLTRNTSMASDNTLKKVKQEIIDIATAKNPNFKTQGSVSGYGETNDHEWFAETFASLEGGKPNELALAMKEWLIENNYVKGGK